MIKEFTHEQVIRFSDTDAAGIVYFGAFATFFDESFLAALRSHGISWEEHREYNFLLPIIEQNIRFHSPLRAGDTIKVIMSLQKIRNRSFTTEHTVFLERDNVLVKIANGTISRVVVDYNNFNPILIPKVLKEILERYQTLEE